MSDDDLSEKTPPNSPNIIIHCDKEATPNCQINCPEQTGESRLSCRLNPNIKFFTQVGFGITLCTTSIVFMATGGSITLWLPILSGTVFYFLPAPDWSS